MLLQCRGQGAGRVQTSMTRKHPCCRLQVKALVAAIDRNSAFVGRARDAVSFSPKDLASAHAFLAKERAARKVRCRLSCIDTYRRRLAPPWSDSGPTMPRHSTSDGCHHVQAPMQQYGDLLTARLQQRQAMRAAEAVPLAAGRTPAEGDSDSEFDDDAEPQPSSQRQTKTAAASKRRHASQNDDEVRLRAMRLNIWLLTCQLCWECALYSGHATDACDISMVRRRTHSRCIWRMRIGSMSCQMTMTSLPVSWLLQQLQLGLSSAAMRRAMVTMAATRQSLRQLGSPGGQNCLK